jgi:hypothetical protein
MPLDQLRCDPFRIDHGFICGHIQMEVLLMNAAERPEGRAERRACSFADLQWTSRWPSPCTSHKQPMRSSIAIHTSLDTATSAI